jgi:hypothetical protein
MTTSLRLSAFLLLNHSVFTTFQDTSPKEDEGRRSKFYAPDNLLSIGIEELYDFPSNAVGSLQRRALLGNAPKPSLPAGLRNQSREEAGYLKLHKCGDVGEAYAASYLITREHLLEQFTGYNLTWVNCKSKNDEGDHRSLPMPMPIPGFSYIHKLNTARKQA